MTGCGDGDNLGNPGIEPTTDDAVIRRAYARELKQHRPDQDPQGYQLREAFDAAKEYAKGEMIWLDDGNVQAAVNLDSVLAGLTQAETHVVPQRVAPAPLQPDWQRETLEEDAERFSVQLLMDESDALNAAPLPGSQPAGCAGSSTRIQP
jgi:hypothetical protein